MVFTCTRLTRILNVVVVSLLVSSAFGSAGLLSDAGAGATAEAGGFWLVFALSLLWDGVLCPLVADPCASAPGTATSRSNTVAHQLLWCHPHFW